MSHVNEIPHQPTVVLVHGAFADSSSWGGVIERLQAQGIRVAAPPNPLRGLAADTAYLASFLNQTSGEIVLVGHSYAGAVISGAAQLAANVAALVFVAAFAPDEGEALGQITPTSEDAILGPALVPHTYPTSDGGTATELFVDPAKVHEVFAGDLPEAAAAVVGATQRPVADAAFSDIAGPIAWKRLPSWAVVATADKAAGTDLVRSMAQRASARITEVDASHVVMISQPDVVVGVILEAVAALPERELAGASS